MYCQYYHVTMPREKICLVVGLLRAEPYLAFDRALDGSKNVFEFFVTRELETDFLYFMRWLQDSGLVSALEKKPNRFLSV